MIRVIDTHTGGEPTRVVVSGVPTTDEPDLKRRVEYFRNEADWLRQSLICEPRGCDWMVGAFVQAPCRAESVASLIFFNNVGYLGMCGHGLIGVVEALAYREQLTPGRHQFDTPVGSVTAELHEDGAVSIQNVVSFRYRKNVCVDVAGLGSFVGDIAFGGNWFFLTAVPDLAEDVAQLTETCLRIRHALVQADITGAAGAEIDHIELFAPPLGASHADSRSFVLCPGGQYDRSPCGTGTSAKLACLAEDGRLAPGDVWRQESIIGSVFEGSYRSTTDGILPIIKGRAFVTGELSLVFDNDDPFRFGIGNQS